MRSRKRPHLAVLVVPVLALGLATAGATPVAAAGASAAPDALCTVKDATLTWGFKESFRSYISGIIARGEWTVSGGAQYETPDFRFIGGAGEIDNAAQAGAIRFAGAITFTGHDGILNTTVANPAIRFDGDTAMLLADVTGTTQDGAEVDERGVEFVSLELSAADTARSPDSLTITGIPATLTDAGAAAFGTYQGGEPFDPVTVQARFDGACTAPAETNWWLIGGSTLVAAAALVAALLWYRLRDRRVERT